jgi:hypothetical protein
MQWLCVLCSQAMHDDTHACKQLQQQYRATLHHQVHRQDRQERLLAQLTMECHFGDTLATDLHLTIKPSGQ